MNVTDHRIGDQVQLCTPTVSDYRVRQMRDRGLRAIPAKLDKSPYARFSGRDSKHIWYANRPITKQMSCPVIAYP